MSQEMRVDWRRMGRFRRVTQLLVLLSTAPASCFSPALAQQQERVRGREETIQLLRQLTAEISATDVRGCSPEPDLQGARRSADWLIGRFGEITTGDIPAAYRQSLKTLVTSLAHAKAGSDRQSLCRVADYAVRDLVAKHQDCKTFGHARTRVSVEIRTVHNGVPQPNWEVYLIWLPEGDRFTGVPRRLESLSTPAKGKVPFPGEFMVFARHPASQRSTPQQQISVSAADPFTWSLTVPAVTAPSLGGNQK
jgi:hypothetical protein